MDKPSLPLRIGTRASPLALAQAHMVADSLRAALGLGAADVVIVPRTTTGDTVQDRALAEIGGKALWTKELEAALEEGAVDMAVHSMKDVETWRPAHLAIGAILPRADVADHFIARGSAKSYADLEKGARLGTSSPRRAAQALHLRPDLQVRLLRGNVDTRLSKLAAGDVDATLLAAAGLARLGKSDIGHRLDPAQFLPAPAQGAVGVEYLLARKDIAQALAAINHAESFEAVMAERALLAGLGGNCHSPIAALASVAKDQLMLRVQIFLPDGSDMQQGEMSGARADAVSLAQELAARVRAESSDALRAFFAGPQS